MGFRYENNPTLNPLGLAMAILVDWLPLQTNILSGVPWYFSDPGTANFTKSFYRAVTP